MPKLLILSSNPRRDLNLDREISDLTTAVQRLGKFEIGLGLGVRSQELPELLTEHSPEIVHFCGHGAGEQGLVFQDEHGRERLVSTEILTRLFKTFQDEVNCVVLNACDSDHQAEAIVAYVNYAVGMCQPILDQAAHIFAVGFYKGLAAGKSVEQAYELGCLAIQIWSEDNAQLVQFRQNRKAEYIGPVTQSVTQSVQPALPEHLKPVLRKRVPASTVPALPMPSSSKEADQLIEKTDAQESRAEPDLKDILPVPAQPEILPSFEQGVQKIEHEQTNLEQAAEGGLIQSPTETPDDLSNLQLVEPPDFLLEISNEGTAQEIDHAELATAAQSDQAVLPESPLPVPPGFTEDVRAEIERKEYKDQARAAYDHFGQFSAENAANLAKTEYAQRKILVGKVKQFWIEGFLKSSLQGDAAIRLELEARPNTIAVSQTIEALSVELDDSFEELRNTQIYEELGQGRTLLILGNPGAGKTIALLQLAERLLNRSEQNLSLPMPVVFNLSSWSKDRKSIVDWLIDELREKYQVPKSLSEPWIREQQLILLLDGLDEVNESYRNDCVRALNEFLQLFPQTEVAICSRVRDYEALTERLQISSALCLQPLSPKQIYQVLDGAGESLRGLKALLKRDINLEHFAQTPLILNLMSSAYQGWSVERLTQELRSTSNHQHLFNTYIDHQLEGTASAYPKQQVLHWLSWLASQMVREKQTVFLIEKMQPTWLKNRTEKRTYRTRNFLTSGLILGLVYALLFGLLGLSGGPRSGLILGLSAGLSAGLFSGLIADSSEKITPLEQLSWSWKETRSKFNHEFNTGIGYGSAIGLIVGFVVGLVIGLIEGGISSMLIIGLIAGLGFGLSFGLLFGTIFGLGGGLSSSEIVQRTVPNQGIRTSLRNGFIVGIVVVLFLVLPFGLIGLATGTPTTGMIIGPSLGLVIMLIVSLKYGGAACIQHFTLRRILHQKGRIPWNYAKFLDFAADRLLIRKIGGGYIFLHRMLLEHFAGMNPN